MTLCFLMVVGLMAFAVGWARWCARHILSECETERQDLARSARCTREWR